MLAVEAGLVLRPQRLHGEHVLAATLARRVSVVDAVVVHLVLVPAEADAERETAAGEEVEGGDGLGRDDRIALGGEQDAGADPERRGTPSPRP